MALVITSAALGTTGKILTLNIGSVGTLPLLPASSVAGFSVSASSVLLIITSAVVSGSTVILSLASAAYSGQPVTLSYTPGNLTDSAVTPNTLASVSNMTVTNSSTTSAPTLFNFTNPAVVISGQLAAVSSYYNLKALGTIAEFTATGTDLSMRVQAGGLACIQSVTVSNPDGTNSVTTTPPNLPAINTDTWVPIFSGLADGPHRVTVRGPLPGSSQALANFLDPSGIAITGGSPALTAPFGRGVQYYLRSTAVRSSIAFEGGGNYDVAYYGGQNGFLATGNFPDARLRFRVQGSGAGTLGVNLWAIIPGETLKVFVDGVYFQTVVAPSASVATIGYIPIPTGITDTLVHLVEVVCITQTNFWVAFIELLNGILSTAQALSERETYGFCGDSITACSISEGNDSTQGWPAVVCAALGKAGANRGVAGQATAGYGSANTPVLTSLAYPGVSPAPTHVFVLMGHNDLAGTASAFQSAYQTMMQSFVSGLPSTLFYCMGILPSTGGNATTLTSFNQAIQNVVTGLANAKVTYADTTNVINPATDTLDGVHPNPGGNNKIAQFAIGLLSAVPLLPFLSLNQGALFADDTIKGIENETV